MIRRITRSCRGFSISILYAGGDVAIAQLTDRHGGVDKQFQTMSRGAFARARHKLDCLVYASRH